MLDQQAKLRRPGRDKIFLSCQYPTSDTLLFVRGLEGYKWHRDIRQFTFTPNVSVAVKLDQMFPDAEKDQGFTQLLNLRKEK